MFLIYLHYRPFQHQLSLRVYLNVPAVIPDKTAIGKRDTAHVRITFHRRILRAVKSSNNKTLANAAATRVWLKDAQDLSSHLRQPIGFRLPAANSDDW